METALGRAPLHGAPESIRTGRRPARPRRARPPGVEGVLEEAGGTGVFAGELEAERPGDPVLRLRLWPM